jgi:hypothetical protein
LKRVEGVEGENVGKEERRKFPDSPFEEPVPLQREGRGMLKLLVQDAGCKVHGI